jgi:branched-chain amino acid transport system ATP-binding protein
VLNKKAAAMLDVARLDSRYGRIPALAGVDLHVNAGELVALVGANGAGKTTLLRVISGVQPASGGAIRFDGQDMARLSARRRVQLGIVQVPEGRQVFGPLSVEDNLLLGAFARGSRDGLGNVFAMFPALDQKRREPAGTLSGGQQQMLAIGRALMAEPKLLLLDEPSMGLAPKLVAEIFATIASLKSRGTTILLVDQNARAALAIADRGYVMETGHVVLNGPAAELLRDPQVQQTYLGL